MNNRFNPFVFFALLVIANSVLLRQQSINGIEDKSRHATLIITVDDLVDKIEINNNQILMSSTKAELEDWETAKKFELNVFSGDIITITGTNYYGFAGIKAKLSFTNSKGELKEYKTGSTWKCNGKAPTTTLTPHVNGLENIEWIWDTDTSKTVSCSFKIPCV